MKLWLKIFGDERMIYNGVFENDIPFNRDNYESYVRDIFHELDIASPLQLGVHYRHITQYNLVKYNKIEFCEEINFEYVTIENIEGKD